MECDDVPTSALHWSWRPQRRCRLPDDPFFDDGNYLCSLEYKYTRESIGADEDDDDEIQSEKETFPCQISGCSKSFSNVSSYERHYNSSHRHMCVECRRSLPSEHLLQIHVMEWHDAMFQLMAAKEHMYDCLVETCPEKFPSHQDRKKHLISTHKYPANFRFHRKPASDKKGVKGKTEADCPASDKMDTDGTSSLSTKPARTFVYKVPKVISFGHSVPRSFQKPQRQKGKGHRHWHQMKKKPGEDTTVSIEDVDMNELNKALEDTS